MSSHHPRRLVTKQPNPRSLHPTTCATVALPFDTVKSIVQVQSAAAVATCGSRQQPPPATGMVQVALKLVREEGGVRRLFRGWQGAFGRAIPGSAATLAVFDIVKDKL